MATVNDVASGVLASLGSDAGLILAVRWADGRYRQLVAQTRFRHLRQVGEVSVPGIVDGGLASATRDSRVVTGDLNAQAAWGVPPGVVGRWFRGARTWYEIDALSQGELRLRSAYAEATTSLAGYKIAARRVELPREARWLGEAVHMRRRRSLGQPISLVELDVLAPARATVDTGGPQLWVEADVAPNFAKRVEFYPYPKQTELIHFVYWTLPARLGLGAMLPAEIDEYVLREGVLIDAMRYEMARALRAGAVEQAAVWRNDMRSQETKWREYIQDAIRADRGVDDVTMILQRASTSAIERDLVTARDMVYDRWPI